MTIQNGHMITRTIDQECPQRLRMQYNTPDSVSSLQSSPFMKNSPKWFTCTPIRFVGDQSFFARDSGLLCKGFQEIGVDCKAIMPGPPMDVDLTGDLIRTDYKNLEDPAWWKSLGGEGVVFYAWGDGRYLPIARAIKASGLIFISHLDTGGMFSVANGLPAYFGSLWRGIMGRRGVNIGSISYYAFRILNALSLRLIRVELPRSKHLKCADIIGAVSPISFQRISRICRAYGGDKLAAKVRHIPHPNASYMVYDPSITKERMVIAVGRWDDEKVKGTDILLATIEKLVSTDHSLTIEIYGPVASKMKAWHDRFPPPLRQRVRLLGLLPNAVLRLALQRARVSLCTSLAEGYHTVSAEALCSGCSVVGPDVPEIPSMKWFTEHGFGRMARREPSALAQAVLDELHSWDAGDRNPLRISEHWTSILHAPRVAELILGIASEFTNNRRGFSD